MVVHWMDHNMKRVNNEIYHKTKCDIKTWVMKKHKVTTTSVHLMTCEKCLQLYIDQQHKVLIKAMNQLQKVST